MLLVSDTASASASADKSGPLLDQLITQYSQGATFTVKESRIVPDNETDIKAALVKWSASGEVDWIITTGGTGFGVRDRTPEVRGLHFASIQL